MYVIHNYYQGWEPQIVYLVVYQVFAATIMQSFWFEF